MLQGLSYDSLGLVVAHFVAAMLCLKVFLWAVRPTVPVLNEPGPYCHHCNKPLKRVEARELPNRLALMDMPKEATHYCNCGAFVKYYNIQEEV